MLLLSMSMQAEDFITQFEYGQMLYQDPRGASCVACHGPTGAGEVIADYTDRAGRVHTLSGPDIRQVTLEQLRNTIRQGGRIMPRYFLTDTEIETIYAYLQQVNRPQKGSPKSLFAQDHTEKNATTAPHKSDPKSIRQLFEMTEPTSDGSRVKRDD
jgi:mono/diheme cytochrome c family protein